MPVAVSTPPTTSSTSSRALKLNDFHGTDPSGTDFDGACRFDTSDNHGHDAITSSGEGYFDRDSKAYNNILNIITGRYGNVVAHGDDPDSP
jgi:hypothetical protein